jgi:hypothetical protein
VSNIKEKLHASWLYNKNKYKTKRDLFCVSIMFFVHFSLMYRNGEVLHSRFDQ